MPAGDEVVVVWRGRRVRACVPALLADRTLALSAATIERTARAAVEVESAAAMMPIDVEPLARLLLRAEGVASSYIEGVSASTADIVIAEHSPAVDSSPASWVAANGLAVRAAVDAAHEAPLDVAALCAWQRTVVAGSPLPARYVGIVRDEQCWIGGTTPFDAALVTPPPERLGGLLDDLIAFCNRIDIDPILQAATAHAQFEIIHPFADGNGRVGRVLVSWLLTRRLAVVTPPPVSVRLATDRGAYLAGMTMFRLGEHEPWVRWFADAVGGAAQVQRSLLLEVDRLRGWWRERLDHPTDRRALRVDALARRVLDLLPRHLVLTSGLVADQLGATPRSATTALADLVRAGVLVEHARPGPRRVGRPAQMFVSPELLGLVGSTPLA